MISGVFGLPGSGKSTYLAYRARKAIRKGQKVYSNYYIEGTYTLDFSRLGKDDYSDCLILIDEISLLCDCRDWKNFTSELKYFFTNHRHYGVDIVWCSQSYKDCDSKIRNVTEELYQCTRSGWFVRVRPVVKSLDVVDGKVSEFYEVRGLGRFVWLRKYWKYFDSFVRRVLPPNTERLWNTKSNNG